MASPSRFENILNFRDVGTTINLLTNTSTLRPNVLYRSARPDTATPADRALLTNNFHIKTIIDLRSETEHINVAKAHANAASIPPAVPDPVSEPQSPPDSEPACSAPQLASDTPASLTIPNVTHHYISLNGPSFERHLVWQLSWSSLAKLLSFMALGYRDYAIAIIGAEVMAPRGLITLGLDTLDHSTREIKTCFDILSDPSCYPIMVHCTQGKDRTGLIILLVLLVCNVDPGAAEADYAMSERELEPEREERMRDIRKVGLDESFAGCPADFVDEVVKWLNERHSGVETYLARIGVGQEQQRTVREILLSKS